MRYVNRLLSLTITAAVCFALFSGCAEGGGSAGKLKVGMVTNSSAINDKSFNQGTWTGLQRAENELGVEIKYMKPGGDAASDYIQEITNLYNQDYKVIVTPGFKFETVVYEMQEKYPDAVFVLLDGEPNDGNYDNGTPNYKTGANTICHLFAEEQAGFLVGLATAAELKSGELGFIGGMYVPAVQRFSFGFRQGIAYANDTYGTECNVREDNIFYQGSFTDKAAGQQLAATMFDRDVKAIFAAAGTVGLGVIEEGKIRRADGEDVWVIGVDVDQYDEGIYDGDKSCVLTSAMKSVDVAAFDSVKAISDGTFEGGRTVVYSAANNGIGIPAENPNLSADTISKVNAAFKGIQDGSIVVSSEDLGLD